MQAAEPGTPEHRQPRSSFPPVSQLRLRNMQPTEPVYEPSGVRPSLCHTCSFVRVVAGRFDQVYLLCQNDLLSEKYPRQPVLRCEVYAPIPRAADEASPAPP